MFIMGLLSMSENIAFVSLCFGEFVITQEGSMM